MSDNIEKTVKSQPVNQENLDVKQLLGVLTAFKKGDFSHRMPIDKTGLAGKVADVLNDIIALNEGFVRETSRVAVLIGREGKTSQRMVLRNDTGLWSDCADSINEMISSLVQPTTEMARVISAVAKGDLSQNMELEYGERPLNGEILRTATTINTMVDQLGTFASEVTRVAREVGTDGRLGGQAEVKGVAGTWKDLTENVNLLAGNLTSQVRNIAEVTTAVAMGDLTRKITVDAKGEVLELKSTINTMVDQLSTFASEVTRVAREVGTDGRLGGQAEVIGAAGTWKDLTDSVNLLVGNLTSQVRNIAEVTTAVAMGDLSKKMTVEVKGEVLELKKIINTMVDQLSTFASEVTRVAREVGTDGTLGGQAEVKGIGGTWKDLTDNVNLLAGNLTNQVRNIAEVTTAVAMGDLNKKITVDAKGEILKLKNTINIMVDQLSTFASEVTRVAREVGTDGKLGGQAEVKGVGGTWKDLTDNVNLLAGNLTYQVRNIATVTTAVANGNLTKKITVDAKGEILELKNTVNTMVDQLSTFASEVTRVAREVGTEGKLGGQADVGGVGGTWKDLTDNVNLLAGNLTNQVRNIATVTTAVANGDLSRKITVDVKGEILELKNTVNTMVDQLNSFASEVTRVSREVGSEGKLGGQAQVWGVSGTWKDLTDSVNMMANNLTEQVRGIAKVVTFIAKGNLKKKLSFDAKGEFAELTETINDMVETLAAFADQVTTVAREVGVEGRLGGQAVVPGAAGTWKDLTDNVNLLAANLSTQVRAISTVATAVAKGDFSRTITVEAKAEVATLKDNLNEMIYNLKETTRVNAEQDWLKTNLAKFNRILQRQRDLPTVCKLILSELSTMVSMQHGVFFINENKNGEEVLKLFSSYGYQQRKNLSGQFRSGEGLLGQCLVEKQRIMLTNVPDDYVKISSGLGEATPMSIVLLPVIFEDRVLAVVELASFKLFSEIQLIFLDQLAETIGITLNTIQTGQRTEELLKQSQSLTGELQSQQEELNQSNEELEEKARMLVEQKTEVERKNREVELARETLEEKANQLALTSKYKSEFLANMSHELRTPLNSLLILSSELSDNGSGNLSEKEVKYSRTIHESGNDLLNMINDILDLSKIESGKSTPEYGSYSLSEILHRMLQMFRPVAQKKGLNFSVSLDPELPEAVQTDGKRVEQVLKNILSNAFKFTELGEVSLDMSLAGSGWNPGNKRLNQAEAVVAFSVRDTGIGIPEGKQKIIFEAFQQADGSTSRKYGGTGLGLAISREIANMLGGEIRLSSIEGKGSTFTYYLPVTLDRTFRKAVQPMYADPAGGIQVQSGLGRSGTISLHGEQKIVPYLEQDERADDGGEDILPTDNVLLIVEDDLKFAEILKGLAREKGFKTVHSPKGSGVIALTRRLKPAAIILDIMLPDIDGWLVMEQLKNNMDVRHVPVHVISVSAERLRGLKQGAVTFLKKPVTKKKLEKALDDIHHSIVASAQNLLVVCGSKEKCSDIVALAGSGHVNTKTAETGGQALEMLKGEMFECIIIDETLPDMSSTEFIGRVLGIPSAMEIPMIVYIENNLPESESAKLENLLKSAVLKVVKTSDALLDETALFLHRVVLDLPEAQRRQIEKNRQAGMGLASKKVLIVDDDMRNLFALTSMLERQDMKVMAAENGKTAIETLKKNPDTNIILMDIMMPEMDGYETMKAIRAIPGFKSLPIIALTAKAMKGDREKCIEAGASDYISKPVANGKLLSLMRVCLF